MAVVPTGEQFELCFGAQRAVVVELGGGIRAYDWGGRQVLHPYPVDAIPDGAHGAPLIPWPNRLADGRYRFAGQEHQLPLTEPGKHNAIHGLLRWRPWQAVERGPDRVVMATRLHPRPGYPFGLDVRISYQLAETGLTVRTTATNTGDRPCPYGCGQHPYLSPGQGLIDPCLLQVDATTRVCTDERRQLPTGTEPVAGTSYDLRTGAVLGERAIDHAFTGLARDDSGRSWVRLTGRDGRTAALWADETYPYFEIFTADTLAPHRRRRGLGAEPMTCPPNAFATGQDVRILQPGESLSTTWGALLS